MYLAAIHRVAAIMSRSILYQSNEFAGFAQMADNLFGYFNVFPFVAPADVVDLSRLTSKEYMLNGRAMVLHSQPIAAMTSIPIERQGLVIDRISDE
jgi:hypothetical protein